MPGLFCPRRVARWLCLGLVVGLTVPSAEAKPPQLKYVFPAGAAAGSTITVQLAGDFEAWPVELVSQPAGLQLAAQEGKGEVQVTVPADAAAGVYLVRAVTAAGVSAWRPFIVGRRPEITETEANNDPSSAQQLDTSNLVISGKLAGGEDVDLFSLPLEAGQTLVLSATANEVLGSPMDMTIQVCDEQGFVLMQVDDERNLDPQLVFPVPRTGRYLVRLMAFPADPNSGIAFSASDDYVYRLTATTGPFVDHFLPLAVQRGTAVDLTPWGWNLEGQVIAGPATVEGTQVHVSAPGLSEAARLPIFDEPVMLASDDAGPANPQAIELPRIICGHLEQAGDVDTFRFTAKANDELRFEVVARELGLPLDAVLSIADAAGTKLAEEDDMRNRRDPQLRFTAPADGVYDLTVRDLHGQGGLRYAYRLHAGGSPPSYSARPAEDAVVVAQGATLDLTLNIDRSRGFAETIQFTADGLPEGCQFTAAASEKEGDSAAKVVGKITANCPPGQYRFRILGQSDSQSVARALSFETAGVEYDQVWLTVTPPAP